MTSPGSNYSQHTIKIYRFDLEFHSTTKQRKKDVMLGKETCVDRSLLDKWHILLDTGKS